jgi:hypothetical protein
LEQKKETEMSEQEIKETALVRVLSPKAYFADSFGVIQLLVVGFYTYFEK